VPLVVVGLLWLEPKAKPHAARIARGVTALALAGVAVEAARILVDLRSGAEGGAGIAPLAVVPGLVLVTMVALPRLLRADRRAYAWVLIFGLYLLVFGLLRTVAPDSPLPAFGTWLRRAEILAGFGVSAGAGLLLFLSSPIRIARPPPRTYGSTGRRVATD
jgi:hypothetical protein